MKKHPAYVDETEFRSNGRKGLVVRGGPNGVTLFGHRLRVVGSQQARSLAAALLRAAGHADTRGAPAVIP